MSRIEQQTVVPPAATQPSFGFEECAPFPAVEKYYPLVGGFGGALVTFGQPVDNAAAIAALGYETTPEQLLESTRFESRYWSEVEHQKEGEDRKFFWERMKQEVLVPAGVQVVNHVLQATGREPEDVDVLVITSTGGVKDMEIEIKEKARLTNVSHRNTIGIYMTCPSGGAAMHWLRLHEAEYHDKDILIASGEVISPFVGNFRDLFSDVGTGMYIPCYGRKFRVLDSEVVSFREPAFSDALKIGTLYDSPAGWDPSDLKRVVVDIGERGMRTYYPPLTDGGTGVEMDNLEVYKWAVGPVVEHVVRFVKKIAENYGVDPTKLIIVPHQANGKMVEKMQRNLRHKLGAEGLQLLFVNQLIGNNSAASTTGALLEARALGLIKPTEDDGQRAKVLLISYGGGLVLSMALVEFAVF